MKYGRTAETARQVEIASPSQLLHCFPSASDEQHGYRQIEGNKCYHIENSLQTLSHEINSRAPNHSSGITQ